jgi:hypothetical protein
VYITSPVSRHSVALRSYTARHDGAGELVRGLHGPERLRSCEGFRFVRPTLRTDPELTAGPKLYLRSIRSIGVFILCRQSHGGCHVQ